MGRASRPHYPRHQHPHATPLRVIGFSGDLSTEIGAAALFASPFRRAGRGPILRGCCGWRLGPADRIRRPSGAGHCVICRPVGSGLAKTRRLPLRACRETLPHSPSTLSSSLRSLGLRSPGCSLGHSRRKSSGGAALSWPPSLCTWSLADGGGDATIYSKTAVLKSFASHVPSIMEAMAASR